MCKCTPEIKTPYCGKGDCKWPANTVKDYETEIAGMNIFIDWGYYQTLIDRITANQEIKPETLGYLLGLAEAVLVSKKCYLCKKPIKKGNMHEPPEYGDEPYRFGQVHEKCYKSEVKKINERNH